MTADSIQHGALVYSSDGEKLGKAKRFFSASPEPLTGETSTEQNFEAGPADTAGSQSISNEVAMARVNSTNDAGGIAVGGGGPLPEDVAWRTGGEIDLGPSDTKYIEVHHGGHLHIGGESLYVPFKAVSLVESDGSIVLGCTTDQAAELYARQPAPLDGE